ncbi:lactate dehydrogenase [Nubsella zeaxanthinifaciens]|uniref:lactate dehydrogenase n=1 Tax=Nubsella zeaxanthinifaciens TaxID=392412 RepID=UPI000DE355DC|nr:lactate dehydrogenase [Nubsella zeaxanthinifaciens]
MKAIAYNIKPEEKECLVLANHKKHDITIIANSLSKETLPFAQGKEVLIVFNEDVLDADLILGLRTLGIKYIATSSFETQHIDLTAAGLAGFKIANVPVARDGSNLAMERMQQVIKNLDNWAAGKCVGKACCCPNDCGAAMRKGADDGQH